MNARTSTTTRATLSALAGLAIAVFAACSSSETPSAACHAGDSEACTCEGGASGHRLCGETACTCAAATGDSGTTTKDAGATDLDGGDGGNLHDGGGSTTTDAAPGTYGADCTSNTDCTDAVYNYCFIGGNRNFCTKACPGGSSDCPSPPTAGMCNMKGYCK